MQFCEKCGSRIRPKQIESGGKAVVVLACVNCGQEVHTNSKATGIVVKEESEVASIKVLDEGAGIRTMPTTQVDCPKCANKEAFWWFLQTRSGDEPATQFYRCTSCSQTWRVYS